MKKTLMAMAMMAILVAGCDREDEFAWKIDSFDDIKILRYRVDGFENLSLQQKKLVYYLSQAAVAGRDIIYDQRCRVNLPMRRALENIYLNYDGDRECQQFKDFECYLKKIWFANGIHHHYSNDKFQPRFTREYFDSLVSATGTTMSEELYAAMFDPQMFPKMLSQDVSKDLVLSSAVNFYDGVDQNEVEQFYANMENPEDAEPISYGLNSRLVKKDGVISEQVYKLGGLYSDAIKQILFWLGKAAEVAENDMQKETILSLMEYYRTGDLKEFDRYSILWLRDTLSQVDFVNGFIEVYDDPLGRKGSWESIVNFKDVEATKRTEMLSNNAQWFEDNSPVDPRFRKPVVKGVSAKVIVGAFNAGDNYPAVAIGINLPNADWIRKEHGSKSVTIGNFTYAYEKESEASGFGKEFFLPEQLERIGKYGAEASDVEVDIHECLGHGSGQLLPGVTGMELKSYSSALEETRAELFGLYYIADKKLQELGILSGREGAWAEYDKFIFNGIMGQLTRIHPGDNIEESHMRSRQLIGLWAMELGSEENVIEKKEIDGKTYITINDYEKLREIFGTMLAEIQRIKSEGDYEAGKDLVEKYAVSVDPKLHAEVLERYSKLGIAPYSGFVNPVYTPVLSSDGEITDVTVSYDQDFVTQQLDYSKNHSFISQ